MYFMGFVSTPVLDTRINSLSKQGNTDLTSDRILNILIYENNCI